MRGLALAAVALAALGLGCGELLGIPDHVSEDGGRKDVDRVLHEGGAGDSRSGDSGEASLPGTAAVSVSSGPNFHDWCAVMVNGDVECWGDGQYGMLGNGQAEPSPKPVHVKHLASAAQVSVGDTHVCARAMDGTVWCWDMGDNGELGNGTTPVDSLIPVKVSLLNGVIWVSAGDHVSCAVEGADGSVWCWGAGYTGLLGHAGSTGGLPPDLSEPRRVDLPPASMVSVGVGGPGEAACAVLEEGGVTCWGGFQASGALGAAADAGAQKGSFTPVPVAGLPKARAVSVGLGFACAIAADNDEVWCWGLGYHYGFGVTPTATAPMQIGLTGIAEIAANSWQDICAIKKADRSVVCLGDGSDGELGNTSIASMLREGRHIPLTHVQDLSTNPIQAQLSGPAVSISTGNAPCAVTKSGTVECWGATSEVALTPVPVMGLTDAVTVAVGGLDDSSSFACAARTGVNGTECWGANGYGQLGSGDLPKTPGDLMEMTPDPTPSIGGTESVSAGAGGDFACGLSGGTVVCWGDNYLGECGNDAPPSPDGGTLPVPVRGLPPDVTPMAVSAGGASACAFMTNGSLYCWGNNLHGQLGDGTTTNRPEATLVAGLSVKSVSVGLDHACAVLADTTVACWGANFTGQLGTGSPLTMDEKVPKQVKGIFGATAVAAGWGSTCAIVGGGAVQCWGDDSFGQLGDLGSAGYTQTPISIANIWNATQIAVGDQSACAIIFGAVWCWGSSVTGDGRWQYTSYAAAPFKITNLLYDVTSIAVGFSTACAVKLGGVFCWGTNSVGQLGLGNGGPRDTFLPKQVFP